MPESITPAAPAVAATPSTPGLDESVPNGATTGFEEALRRFLEAQTGQAAVLPAAVGQLYASAAPGNPDLPPGNSLPAALAQTLVRATSAALPAAPEAASATAEPTLEAPVPAAEASLVEDERLPELVEETPSVEVTATLQGEVQIQPQAAPLTATAAVSEAQVNAESAAEIAAMEASAEPVPKAASRADVAAIATTSLSETAETAAAGSHVAAAWHALNRHQPTNAERAARVPAIPTVRPAAPADAEPALTESDAVPMNVAHNHEVLQALAAAKAEGVEHLAAKQLRQDEASVPPPTFNTAEVDSAAFTGIDSGRSGGGSGASGGGGAVPTLVLNTPLHKEQWAEGFGTRITWMVKNDMQGAELKINPPHLGPIQVRIQVSDDQANVSFVTQHGVVREAVEAALPKLREMLAENGLTLGSVDVSQQQGFERHMQEHPGRDGRLSGPVTPGYDTAEPEEGASPTSVLVSDGLVDYFA